MRNTSRTIIGLVLSLATIGVVMVASTSLVQAESLGDCAFLNKQLVWVALAVVGMVVLMKTDYHKVARYAPHFMAATVVVLILVLIPGIGTKIHGARRWIRLFGMSFQPSEMGKLAVILFVASWFGHSPDRIRSFGRGFLPMLGVSGIIAFLICVEPDLGTSALVFAVGLGMALLAGVRVLHVGALAAPSLALLYYFIWGIGWRQARLLAWLDPWKYQEGVGYQLCQAFVALGSGGIGGVGLGGSRQKLDRLPQAVNDFIFAVLGEEFGFIGTMVVVLLFALLIYYGIRVAMHAPDILGYLIASGVTMMIGLQAIFNMAVVTGSVPTKGISLPFVSFGGSSMVFLMCAVGVLLNIAHQAEQAEAATHAALPTID